MLKIRNGPKFKKLVVAGSTFNFVPSADLEIETSMFGHETRFHPVRNQFFDEIRFNNCSKRIVYDSFQVKTSWCSKFKRYKTIFFECPSFSGPLLAENIDIMNTQSFLASLTSISGRTLKHMFRNIIFYEHMLYSLGCQSWKPSLYFSVSILCISVSMQCIFVSIECLLVPI